MVIYSPPALSVVIIHENSAVKAQLTPEGGRVRLLIYPSDLTRDASSSIFPFTEGKIYEIHFYRGNTPDNVIGDPAGNVRVTSSTVNVDESGRYIVEVEQCEINATGVGAEAA